MKRALLASVNAWRLTLDSANSNIGVLTVNPYVINTRWPDNIILTEEGAPRLGAGAVRRRCAALVPAGRPRRRGRGGLPAAPQHPPPAGKRRRGIHREALRGRRRARRARRAGRERQGGDPIRLARRQEPPAVPHRSDSSEARRRPATSREQGGVSLKMALLRALLRRLIRARSPARWCADLETASGQVPSDRRRTTAVTPFPRDAGNTLTPARCSPAHECGSACRTPGGRWRTARSADGPRGRGARARRC